MMEDHTYEMYAALPPVVQLIVKIIILVKGDTFFINNRNGVST